MPSENKSRETPLEPENDPDVPTSTWDPERGQVWIEPETKPLPYNRAFQATSSLTAAAESAVLAVASIAKSISKDHGQPSTDRVEPLERCSTIEELD
mmetsp:Transcript_20715/g.27244  ORF Transcript_20715/g.27244 Transcript_20715/m.27244 type:complete len:97 (-) Transcript_20715:2-292(-)